MRIILAIAALGLAVTAAEAQIARRDRIEHRFENDIRANKEAMSKRFSGPNHRIDAQNTRMRERLNSTRNSPLRSR